MPFDGASAARAGSPREIRVAWKAQPGPQTALMSCPIPEIFFGGARGGGKTAGAIGRWLAHAGRYGAKAQGVFFRRRFRDLEGAHLQMARFFRPLGAYWLAKEAAWIFPNGAKLRLRHLWDERDADAYQGHEYTFLCFEEAGQWPSPKPIDMLRATLRSVDGVQTELLLTGNPGGAGHLWLKQRYIVPARRGFRPIRDPDTGALRVFIPSRLTDNAILTQADPLYERRLRQLGSRTLVRAWLDGDWDIVAGGAFDDVWNPDRQVLPPDFQVPASWRYRRAFDWGSARPAALGIWAESDGTMPEGWEGPWMPKGSLVLVRELYTVRRDDAGEPVANEGLGLDNDALGERVAETSEGLRFSVSAADPSIWNRMGGLSILEQMAVGARRKRDPWQWVKADNGRVAGFQRVRGMLAQSAAERAEEPGIWVLETCTEWLRTVPVQQRDPKKPDDIDTEGEDHHADQTRYAVQAPRGSGPGVAPVVVR